MSIPSLLCSGLLPEGIHSASLGEIHATFVESAPHQERRQVIFDALKAWVGAVSELGVDGILWIDGGFVTHKANPPEDVDVVLRVKPSTLDGMSHDAEVKFSSLLTDNSDPKTRIQPMGGLVDAFLALRSNPDRTLYWKDFWSKVKDDAGNQIAGVYKGFVEVKL